MSKRKQSQKADFFGNISKCSEPETLTEDDSKALNASAEHDDTRPQDSKT